MDNAYLNDAYLLDEIPAEIPVSISPTENVEAMVGIFLVLILLSLILSLFSYIYLSFCLMRIAGKTKTENAWFAWVPILSFLLMLQIAKKPSWWLILMLLPIVQVVIFVIVMMEIAEKLGKPSWLGVLMLLPIANLIIPGYLAFSKSEVPTTSFTQNPTGN